MDIDKLFKPMLEQFKKGKLQIDFSYSFIGASPIINRLNFHEPYVWNGKQDPVYLSYNSESKSISANNVSYNDLQDKTIKTFLGVSE